MITYDQKLFDSGNEHYKQQAINGIVKKGLEGVSLAFANEILSENPQISYKEMIAKVEAFFGIIEKHAPIPEGKTFEEILGKSNWYTAYWKDKPSKYSH